MIEQHSYIKCVKTFTFLWCLIGYCLIPGHCSDYYEFGCYRDSSTDRDLYTSEITFPVGVMTINDCVKECVSEGQPYAGLQEGRRCYCGPTYGKHGKALSTITCNFTCNQNTEFCGGVTANSVYYTIKTDSASKQARSLRKYETPKNFAAARETCVKNDGDLAVAKTAKTVDDIVALFADVELNASQRKLWLGLYKLSSGADFQWVDPSDTFVASEVAGLWNTGEPGSNLCVVIDIDNKKLETSSCLPTYPFACFDRGAAPLNEDYPDDTSGTTTEEPSSSNTLALAIVLPIFAICYGGSCLLYCIHKIHRNFKRSKRKKMLLERDDSFTEFEPETKPSTVADKSLDEDINTGMVFSKPVPPYMKHDPWITKKQSLLAEGPAEESEPEPPSRPPSGQPPPQSASSVSRSTSLFSRESVTSLGPIVSSRPTTSEGVRISMDESSDNSPPGTANSEQTPPNYYQSANFQKQAKKVRAERRRNKLLENALKEARERRAKEQSSLGMTSRSSTATVRPRGSISSASFSTDEVVAPPPAVRPRSNRSDKTVKMSPRQDSDDSKGMVDSPSSDSSQQNESMTSLINDDQRSSSSAEVYDPTKMSIADIIKIKQMMKERKKKKVRKILST